MQTLIETGLDDKNFHIKSNAPNYYHPGKSGAIYQDSKSDKPIAFFGEIHPNINQKLQIKTEALILFEIFLDRIELHKNKLKDQKNKYEYSDFQKSERDFAFIIDKNLNVQELVKIIYKIDNNLIKNVKVFDLYEGENIPSDKKSIALNVTIQSLQKSLNDKDLEKINNLIISTVESKTGAKKLDPKMSTIDNIRNFAIIAHIDHGKSTIADRIIHKCGGLTEREMKAQVLDSMDIERERGITIKAQTVKLNYKSKDGKDYILNIIDTPGHVDFSYEVSRSLYACEGSILIVDSTQGVEAQTLANVYQAMDTNHEIIPILNKIDLPASEIEKTKNQIEEVIGIDTSNSVPCSGKTGEGIDEILEKIIQTLPPPRGNKNDILKCLLVDSWYDSYLGVVILIRVIDGKIKKNMKIKMMSTNQEHIVEKVGVFTPKPKDMDELNSGEIGFIITGIKNLSDTKVGDTICEANKPLKEALPGFKPSKPVVFCGLFPVDSSEYQKLKDGLAKLKLNDSSFSYEPESSSALGLGFRCGFLGLLHLEIITERLEREFDINLLTTTPGVVYKVHLNNDKVLDLQNPSNLPDPTIIKYIEEPWIKATIITPDQYLGPIIKICQNKRGIQTNLNYSGNRAVLNYEIPLNEVVFDFNDRLKSITSGYASFDYEIIGHREGELVKLSILVNGEPVDALAMMVHKDFAQTIGREVCEKLKDLIPRHNFMIPIQAAIGGKIIARETIKGFKKDVLTKIHGGGARDRKRKLLDKQKKGKARSKQFGKVEIPQEAFIGVLKINKD